MLISLHVKNLALIKEAEVNFKEGLNILSGETGAGKSIIIGSINLALGARADKELIRKGAEYALIELIFQISDAQMIREIKALEIPIEEDGIIIIQRKIQATRSICKICGETATTKQLKELSELLIDIHGQHEHQSLLYKKNHLAILDAFAGEELEKQKQQIAETYRQYQAYNKELVEFCADDGMKAKELSLATFEYSEIEDAKLVVDEDIELENEYRRMANIRQIAEGASKAHQLTAMQELCVADAVGYAVRELRSIEAYDDKIKDLANELSNIDGLINDFNRNLSQYLSDMTFDEEVFYETQERLNVLNHLKLKYGGSIEKVLQYQQELAEKIEKLQNADAYKEQLQRKLEQTKHILQQLCKKATEIRTKEAKKLSKDMIQALTDLNFLEVQFEIQVRPKDTYSSSGMDDVEFMISTNPGEALKSLGSVASGGELSRIMLALKTVLASRDKIPTMIFDEIDTGISGKTAWKVSNKLGELASGHQIICITHLPQIAAMADQNFKITKQAIDNETQTGIVELSQPEVIEEMARLLGGEEITDTVRENAKELIHTARQKKEAYR